MSGKSKRRTWKAEDKLRIVLAGLDGSIEISELCRREGINPTQCRMLRRLIERGFLNTVPVHKQNENVYGQLFVDGSMLSLVRPRQTVRLSLKRRSGRDKMSTPQQENVNAPLQKKSTLRNVNPKKEIEEQEKFVLGLKAGFLGQHVDPELQRIAVRAAQMADNAFRQAA